MWDSLFFCLFLYLECYISFIATIFVFTKYYSTVEASYLNRKMYTMIYIQLWLLSIRDILDECQLIMMRDCPDCLIYGTKFPELTVNIQFRLVDIFPLLTRISLHTTE